MFEEAKEKGVTLTQLLSKHEKFSVADSEKFSALSQQLASRNLKLSGAHAALVSDFFQTDDNKVLFVETINEAVRTGLDSELKSFANISDIVATRTGIKGGVYEGAEVDMDNSKSSASRVSEGGSFPKVKINFKDKAIKLSKIGYQIDATYETIRRMRVNTFLVTMMQIGRNIARDKVSLAINTLINGDGNSNPIVSVNAATSGVLTYADVVNLLEEFRYFDPTLMIAPKEMRVKYLNLAEYKDKNGPTMPEPPKKSDAVPAGKIIALDGKAALEEVYELGGSLVDYDKIIEKQIETAVVSEVTGFSKLFTEAAVMLNG
jgi:expansin (peptidoglycan-binding protein)